MENLNVELPNKNLELFNLFPFFNGKFKFILKISLLFLLLKSGHIK